MKARSQNRSIKISRRKALVDGAKLLGISLSAGLATSILESCAGDKPDYIPRFFSLDQFKVISRFTEIILPATDTPGGLEAGVDRFIDIMLAEATPQADRDRFISAFNLTMEKCKSNYRISVTRCDDSQLTNLLREIANQEDTGFYFRKMKELALLGYFTSEIIGTEVLRYDPVPGSYQGCIPLEGKTLWTLG